MSALVALRFVTPGLADRGLCECACDPPLFDECESAAATGDPAYVDSVKPRPTKRAACQPSDEFRDVELRKECKLIPSVPIRLVWI